MMKNMRSTMWRRVGKPVLAAVNATLFVLLLLTGRIVVPIDRLASTAGVMLFLFCALFRRDLVTPMWVGAGVAIGSGVVILLYQALLARVAPEGTVIFTPY